MARDEVIPALRAKIRSMIEDESGPQLTNAFLRELGKKKAELEKSGDWMYDADTRAWCEALEAEARSTASTGGLTPADAELLQKRITKYIPGPHCFL